MLIAVYAVLIVLSVLFIISIVKPHIFQDFISQSKELLEYDYSINGYSILVVTIYCLMSLFFFLFYISIFWKKKPNYYDYKEDIFKNIYWTWKWKKEKIINMEFFCNDCDSELCAQSDHLLFKTNFTCPNCNKTICSYDGDNLQYVKIAIKNEIKRKIHKQEYK